MAAQTWRRQTYQRTYERSYAYVEARKQRDPRFCREELEAMLKHAYIRQGNSWAGRGKVSEVIISATIAAYEACLAEWEQD